MLHIENLSVTFLHKKSRSRAVSKLSLHIGKGEILALVGESGSGKSLTALSILRLLPPAALVRGKVHFCEQDLSAMTEAQMRKLRGSRISMIFQEPMTALNPLHTIGKQIREVIQLHEDAFPQKGFNMHEKILQLLEDVGLAKLKNRLDAYPHQLSGGERQRVMIAMAMACEPELLIADEPTTAVDVTIQAQILALLKDLQKTRGLSILLITHDLTIVRKVADRVAIMQRGKLVEEGITAEVFANPQQEYTQKLLGSEPKGIPTPPPLDGAEVILADKVTVRYPTKRNFFGKPTAWFHAADGISVSVREGMTLGIVGESGSGKTTFALALLRLTRCEGRIVFLGQGIEGFNNTQMRPYRDKLQIVFQDPFGSLNPRMTINQIIGEGLRVHRRDLTRFQRRKKVREILGEMHMGPEVLDRYPHEFSGGQRQRIAIARAMVLDPKMVVLDEPTSALDLTVQAQIIELLRELQRSHATTFLFISHDLRVVRSVSHEVMVMQQGKVVEHGTTEQIFTHPRNPYTKQLIDAAFLETLAS